MIEPYEDRPGARGSLLVNASELTNLAKSWTAAGFQVNIHAIGDMANRLAIDALISSLKLACPSIPLKECQQSRRFRIEHSQIVHPADQQRMLHVGLIPSIQPTHATSDMYYAEKRLGHIRTVKEAYRMRSLRAINPILGSDFPVEPPNPFEGIYAAITRKNPHTLLDANGTSRGWYAEQTLNLDEALRGFTLHPAYGAFLEGRAGVIRKDAFADWIVLDRSVNDVSLDELPMLEVRETWVNGRCVYKRSEIS
jgi:predicted amidohydrolase YtcJ